MTPPSLSQRFVKLATARLSALERAAARGEEVSTRELSELKAMLQSSLAEQRDAAVDSEVRRLNDLTRRR